MNRGRRERRYNVSTLVRRSRRYPFNRIPQEIKEEILLKMKAKHISKLISVSRFWSSLVRSKDFTNLYLSQSLTRPRILFSIATRDIEMQLFDTSSQEDPSSDHDRVTCYLPKPAKWYEFSPPVRGLICCLDRGNNKVMIGNPSTGQFITLPRVKTVRKDVFSVFGYDPVNDEYKVLCMTVSRHCKGGPEHAVSEEHQVFTLGATIRKWKMIECKHLHRPGSQGICSNGVMYYLGWINNVRSLICFDMGSEEFSVIKLPGDVRLLSNYKEKIAVTNPLSNEGTLDLWVLEDASKQEWSKVSIVIPCWRDLLCRWFETYLFRGILGTGELIFAPSYPALPYYHRPAVPYFFLCYDLKKNKARRIRMTSVEASHTCVEVYLDHVESPMFLQL